MGMTLTRLAGALKRDYHGPIIDALNNMTVFYRLLEKNEEDVRGEDLSAYIPIKTRRNQGIGARAENAAVPSARHVQTIQLIIPLAYNYGSIEFTGQSMKASEKSETAFANVVDMEVNSMVEGIKIDTNRQMIAPESGYLCQTNGTGAGASSTVTVDNPGTQWLEEGMPIQSFSDTTTATAVGDSDISQGLTESTSHIVGKILSDTTFRLDDYDDTEVTTELWANNRYLFRWGARGNEMYGLMDIIDDYSLQSTSSWFGLGLGLQTIHGRSRSTYSILESNISHNSGAGNQDLTEKQIQDDLDGIEKASGKTNDAKSMIMLTTYGVRKMYIDLLQGDRRYMKPLELVGGWKALGYQAGNDYIPWVVDRHAVPNSMLYLDRRFLAVYRASNFDWMDFDGNMFDRKHTTDGRYDAYEATMYSYMSLGCKSFKNQGARREISES